MTLMIIDDANRTICFLCFYLGKEKQKHVAVSMRQFSAMSEESFVVAATAKTLRSDLQFLFPVAQPVIA